MRIEEIVATLCKDCKESCEKEGTVPECWGQYGNPCSEFLNKMESDENESFYK